MKNETIIRDLINRLARMDAAASWGGDLNPTQRDVLRYLGQANRFSRSPSHVAEYLGTTRGTVSQSFKSLVHKGYVSERRSALDKRAISFELTRRGVAATAGDSLLDEALAALDLQTTEAMRDGLTATLRAILAQNNGRGFGLCRTCVHHETTRDGGYCRLLSVPLAPEEADQICHEQQSALFLTGTHV